MKRFAILAMALLMAYTVMAQSVQETSVQIGALTIPAYTVTIQKDKKVVRDALDQRMKELKLKSKKTDGYVASLGKVCQEIGGEVPINLYTKVDGSKSSATVTICATSTILGSDQQSINYNVSRFVSNFVGYTDRYVAQQQVEVEKANVKQAEKRYKAAQSDLKKIESKTAKERKLLAERKDELDKCQKRIKECEKEIKELEATINRSLGKNYTETQQRVQESEQALKTAKTQLERYQQMAQ